jgi:hypothetical protein
VQTVFLDPAGRAAAGGALAAEPPALLVDRDAVAAAVLGARQLERRGHRGAAATDDGDADRVGHDGVFT